MFDLSGFAGQIDVQSLLGVNSREAAIARLKQLPENIQEALVKQKKQLVNMEYYVVKSVGGVATIKMFNGNETITPGVSNILNSRLENENWVLMKRIGLLAGVNADPLQAAFDFIPAVIANGHSEFRGSDNKWFIAKNFSNNAFLNSNQTVAPKGCYTLENPKWIKPQTELTMDVSFAAAAAANTQLKFIIAGTVVVGA